MRVFYFVTIVLISLLLLIGYWLDNEILSPIFRLWWLPLIAAYVGLSVRAKQSDLSKLWKYLIAGGSGCLMLLTLFLFDDILTIYLSGGVVLFCHLTIEYLCNDTSPARDRSMLVTIVLVAISLTILPVSVNRVVVTLPNLSAGTYLTLHESEEDVADLSAQFFNRIDDHHELTVSLGSQWYFQQPHQAPRLRIDILRDKIVVRLISIRYDTRLAFLHLPLFEISGDSLKSLEAIDGDASIRLHMERDKLLIDRLETDKPAWIQLPHMENHTLSSANYFLIWLVRLTLWLLICFGLISWSPTATRSFTQHE